MLKRTFQPLLLPYLVALRTGRIFRSIASVEKPDETKDYYETLGIDLGANEQEVKDAYRRLAKKYHPDISTEDSQHEPNADKFREVAEAYAVLSVYESRLEYNNARTRKLAASPERSATPVEVQEYSHVASTVVSTPAWLPRGRDAPKSRPVAPSQTRG